MSDVFLNLPVPGAVGVGASIDTSTMAGEKTIIVGGSFVASLTVEASADGTNWAPVATFSGAAPRKNVVVAACFMRVRVTVLTSGTPTVDVAAERAEAQRVTLAIPAGNGSGASSNTSTMGRVRTLYVCGTFTGSITVEGSNDGTTWSAIATVNSCDQTTLEVMAQFMRVTRANVNTTSPGTPIVGVCGTAPPAVEFVEAVTNVFVDSVSGSDANNGLSAATALATLDEVYRRFPAQTIGSGEIIINLADNGASGPADYPTELVRLGGGQGNVASYRYVGPAMVPVVPTTGPSTAALDVTPSVRVDNTGAASGTGGRSRLDFTAAAPGWTVDDFQGAFLRVTRSGSLVFFELPITKNTADTLTVDHEGIVPTLLATDTVEIVQPGARIFSPSGGAFGGVYIEGYGEQFAFFTVAAFAFTRITMGSAAPAGVASARNISGLSFDRCLFTASVDIQNSSVKLANCSSIGMVLKQCSVESHIGSFGTVTNTVPQMDIVVIGGRIDMIESDVLASQNWSVWDVVFAVRWAIRVFGGSFSIGDAGAGARLQGLSASASTVGLQAQNNADVQVAGGALTVITGVGGDIEFGSSGNFLSYGTGVGALEEVAGFNGFATEKNVGTATVPVGDSTIVHT